MTSRFYETWRFKIEAGTGRTLLRTRPIARPVCRPSGRSRYVRTSTPDGRSPGHTGRGRSPPDNSVLPAEGASKSRAGSLRAGECSHPGGNRCAVCALRDTRASLNVTSSKTVCAKSTAPRKSARCNWQPSKSAEPRTHRQRVADDVDPQLRRLSRIRHAYSCVRQPFVDPPRL